MEIQERDVREVASEDMAKTLLESLILLIRMQTKTVPVCHSLNK